MTTNPRSGSARMAYILEEMNIDGGFPIAILTDRQGFPIASAATSDQDPEKQSAVVALVQKTAEQVRDQLDLAHTDEISVFGADGQRLVCRPFTANEHDLILAVLVPDRKSYRRLTNRAVHAVRRNWKL